MDKKVIDNAEKIIDWMDDKYGEEKWIKYKFTKNVFFELKDFFPDPQRYICEKMVEIELKNIKDEYKNGEKLYFFGEIYNEKEFKNELIAWLQKGEVSGINIMPSSHPFAKKKTSSWRLIEELGLEKNFNIFFADIYGEEEYWMINSNYYVLEYGATTNACAVEEGVE